MSNTSARVICDSYATTSPRLTTFSTVFHKFVLAERNRHRMFSLSDRSSRAVPTSRLLEEVKKDPAMPIVFRKNIKGMSGGEEMVGEALKNAQSNWYNASMSAIRHAELALECGEAKETANRHLDTYVYCHSVITSCEDGLLNFFGLRLDKAAQPEIKLLAENMWVAWNESKPKKLETGQWHIPFIDQEDYDNANRSKLSSALVTPDNYELALFSNYYINDCDPILLRISAARCARTSYNSFDTNKRSTIEEDLSLFNKLISNLHVSPTEHQATPSQVGTEGNFPWYIQHRKFIKGEDIAKLPEGYVYNYSLRSDCYA